MKGIKILMILPMLEVNPIAVDLIVELKLYVWKNTTKVLKETEQPR